MFRSYNIVRLCAGMSAIRGMQSFALAEEKSSGASTSPGAPTLAVYLNTESKATLAALLPKMGVVDKGWSPPDRIVLKNRMDEVDHYVYAPIYGERVAFRLKGIIRCEEGVVGIGRLSNMQGEMNERDFETSVVLETKLQTSSSIQGLADLPTLLFQNVDAARNKNWKGSAPGGEVLGVTYRARKGVSVEHFTPDVQLVIDGHICNSKYIGDDGCSCTFEKSDIPDDLPDEVLKKRVEKGSGPEGTSNEEVDTKEGEDDDGETCPVCRFMKKGPCGHAFRAWDDCVQGLKEGEDLKKCFHLTVEMMECMKQHEYYDIMTANSALKIAQLEETEEATKKAE